MKRSSSLLDRLPRALRALAHEPAGTEEALLEAFSCCRAQSSLVVSYKVRQLHAEPTRWVERRCCLA
jgi:hypothetical protein